MPYLFKGKNRITQRFKGTDHWAIDIVGDDDRTVYSVFEGTVDWVQTWDGVTISGDMSLGNCVRVKGTNGYRFYYAHLDSMAVKKGDTVKVGTKIGVMGATGHVTGAHLHFGVWTGTTTSTAIDPCPYANLTNVCGSYYPVDLDKDGNCGAKSVTRLQNWLGTTQDGKVSEQDITEKTRNPNLTNNSAWEFKKNPSGGSDMIRALQKYLNSKINAGLKVDGFIGVLTITAWQKYVGTTQDGVLSKPSDCIKKTQELLNNNLF